MNPDTDRLIIQVKHLFIDKLLGRNYFNTLFDRMINLISKELEFCNSTWNKFGTIPKSNYFCKCQNKTKKRKFSVPIELIPNTI